MRAAKNRVHPLVGCLFRKVAITYRVLAVCENYAMMRAKGYAPFCVYVKDLERDYFKIETPNLAMSGLKPRKHLKKGHDIQTMGTRSNFRYISNWQEDKMLKCACCGTTKSVKYQSSENGDTLCNFCVWGR